MGKKHASQYVNFGWLPYKGTELVDNILCHMVLYLFVTIKL